MQAEQGRSTVYLLMVERLLGRSTVYLLSVERLPGTVERVPSSASFWLRSWVQNSSHGWSSLHRRSTVWGHPCTAVLSRRWHCTILWWSMLRAVDRGVTRARFWPLGKINTWVYRGGSIPLSGRPGIITRELLLLSPSWPWSNLNMVDFVWLNFDQALTLMIRTSTWYMSSRYLIFD